MEILLVSFLIFAIFYIAPILLLPKLMSLTRIFSTKIRRGKYSHKNINIPVPFYQNSVTPPLPSAKTIKKVGSSMLDRVDTYIDRGLCIFLMQMLKTVSISFINCEFIRTLYSVGLILNLQRKQVMILLYVQEQGGILFKFNFLRLHYVTDNCP